MNQQFTLPWWKFTFESNSAEEISFDLHDIGAKGLEIVSPERVVCFFQGQSQQSKEFLEKAILLGFSHVSSEEVFDKNWVQECRELLQPIVFDDITITPKVSAQEPATSARTKINIEIIPGQGFGTGHHPATRMAIKMIAKLGAQKKSFEYALDLGTGSGILAIAVNKILGSKVDAYDIDEMALINAKDNVAINAVEESINIKLGSIDQINKKFSLIVANIYAEVLCRLENEFRRCLEPGGILIVSGIMQSLSASIRMCFNLPYWEHLETLQEDGWVSSMFKLKDEI